MTRALAVLTAALLLVAVSSGAASAREVVLRDAAGDMWRQDRQGNVSEAPTSRAGDVRKALFRHGRKNLVVRQRFVDLRRSGDYAQYVIRIESARGIYRELRVEASSGSWAGKSRVFNRRGDLVECSTTHDIDYAVNAVVMTVSRSCLGTPRTVRATASNYRTDVNHLFLMDNPHNTESSAQDWTRWLRVS